MGPNPRSGDEQILQQQQQQQLHTPNSLGQPGIADFFDDIDWNTAFADYQPQQWLTPATLPWEHWGAVGAKSLPLNGAY